MSSVRALQGPVSWAAVDVPKRGVSVEDIRYAEANRPRLGWQTIANIRGVNVLDLRRACGDPSLDPDFKPAPPPPAAKPMRRRFGFVETAPSETGRRISRADSGARKLAVLKAIRDGAGSPAEAAERLGMQVHLARNIVHLLRNDGLVDGDARRGWLHLTEAGFALLPEQADG